MRSGLPAFGAVRAGGGGRDRAVGTVGTGRFWSPRRGVCSGKQQRRKWEDKLEAAKQS